MFIMSSGTGHADIVFNQFDSSSEVSGWTYHNWSGSPGSISWSTNNAPGTGSAGSGSMEMQITFDSASEWGCAFISSAPAVDLSGATFVEFDLMVDPASPLDPDGNVFYFQLGFPSPYSGELAQFWLGPYGTAFTTGVWQHFKISIPPGSLATNEAQLFILLWSDSYASAETPIVYIDNIQVDELALNVAIQASYTNVPTEFTNNFTGTIVGHASLSTWDFGDGTVVSNQTEVTHSWMTVGDYPVVFTAYNDSNPGGISATVTVHVLPPSPISVAFQAGYTNVSTGFTDGFTGTIVGDVSLSTWDFGDGTVVSNQLNATHSWTTAGDYPVVFTAYNDSNPAGVSTTVTVHVTSALIVALQAGYTYVSTGFTDSFTGTIVGNASLSTWDFGDGTVVSNQLNVTHSWMTAGDYPVVFTAYNDSAPGMFSATVTVHVISSIHYVALNSANPAAPYSSWATAATNIQDAVDAANPGDQIFVTNGVYQTGGRLVPGDSTTNRLAVTNAVTIQSVNGPAATIIQGYQVPGTTNGNGAVRCVYLANNAKLIGFTLAGGATQTGFGSNTGGGVKCQSISAVLSNCVVVGNVAVFGGGAFSGTFYNCVLSNNIAQYIGGGGYTSGYTGGSGGNPIVFYNSCFNNCLFTGNAATYGGAVAAVSYCGEVFLNNCTVCGNSASFQGGGLESFTSPFMPMYAPSIVLASNCIVYGNTAPTGSNYFANGILTLNYCCTAPLPSGGINNFTNDPLFMNPAAGDYHLQSNSPCINAGNNYYVTSTTDLDGNARIVGGTVDIGAYEFQSPVSRISYAWLQQYGLPISTNTDFSDADNDGMNNWQEWRTGTNPTNALSVLKMASAAPTNSPPGLVVTWQSVSGITYFLQRGTNLGAQPAFSTIQSNIAGQAGTTSYTDITATNGGPYFYRVGVQ
jgi:PKD repeat protein